MVSAFYDLVTVRSKLKDHTAEAGGVEFNIIGYLVVAITLDMGDGKLLLCDCHRRHEQREKEIKETQARGSNYHASSNYSPLREEFVEGAAAIGSEDD